MSRIATLWLAFQSAFDSLVRTYTPLIISTAVAWLVSANVEVTPEVKSFLGIAVAFLFFVLWYGLNRLWELVTGKVSKLLTLGLVKTKPAGYLTAQESFNDLDAKVARERAAEARRIDIGE